MAQDHKGGKCAKDDPKKKQDIEGGTAVCLPSLDGGGTDTNAPEEEREKEEEKEKQEEKVGRIKSAKKRLQQHPRSSRSM